MKIGKVNIDVDKELKTAKQYSKVWMTRWQFFSMFNIQLYIIADIFYNRAININNVVIALISGVIISLIPYFAKSFLETREDKKIQLEREKLQYQYNDNSGNVFYGNNNIYETHTPVNDIDTERELG
jgi:hypothetical protein